MTSEEIDRFSEEEEVLVSVIVAAYNCRPFVERAIESALCQKISSIEVIAVDDHSDDGTLEYLLQRQELDSRIVVARTDRNGGPSTARNMALNRARGKWVAVLDADDAFAPGRLARLIEAADSFQAQIVFDTFLEYDHLNARTRRQNFIANSQTDVLTLSEYVSKCRPFRAEPDYGLLKPVFKREFLRERGIRYREDVRHGEDFEIVVDCLCHNARAILVRESKYLYTTRESGLSRTSIDYSAVINQSKELQSKAIRLGHSESEQAFSCRIESLGLLAVEHSLKSHWRGKKFAQIFFFLLRERSARRVLVMYLQKKLRNACMNWNFRKGPGQS